MARLLRHKRCSPIEDACLELLGSASSNASLVAGLQAVFGSESASASGRDRFVEVAHRVDEALHRPPFNKDINFILFWRKFGHLLRNLSYSSSAVAEALKQLDIGFHAEALTLKESGELEMLSAMADYFDLIGAGRPVYFDVGANRGEWMRAVCGFRSDVDLHVFEPQHDLVPILSAEARKVLMNDARSSIRINPFGLSDKSEIASLFMSDESDVLASTIESVRRGSFRGESRVVDIRLETGDSYCRDAGISSINCLKIDVEGAELKVLKGFEYMLAKRSVQFIQFEYGKTTALAGGSLRGFFDHLSSSHILLKVSPEGFFLMDESSLGCYEDYRWSNYLAVSQSHAASFLDFLS